MPKPDRTVIVDGNCFWMEVEPQGGYLIFAPVLANGSVEWENAGELDSRAFRTTRDYDTFRESIRFLLTYKRG